MHENYAFFILNRNVLKIMKLWYNISIKGIDLDFEFLKKGGFEMATSSFNKDFTLSSKSAVDSFAKIISTPTKSVKVDRDIISPEKERRGEIKLKQMLSR